MQKKETIMNISDLMIGNVCDSSEDIFSDVCTVGEFLKKYGKVEFDEESFEKQLEYLDTIVG